MPPPELTGGIGMLTPDAELKSERYKSAMSSRDQAFAAVVPAPALAARAAFSRRASRLRLREAVFL